MLASLIAGLATTEAVQMLRRIRQLAITYLIAGIAVACGAGFLIGAAFMTVARYYGHISAAIGFGIGFFVLAGIIILIDKISAGAQVRKTKVRRSSEARSIGIAAAVAAVPLLLRNRTALGALAGPLLAVLAFKVFQENSRKRIPGADKS
ncbi:hypothetical protein QBK99_16415 [Corticibacterium sp. UT-5YL-CI-8]|nr:hypothetical protein [Tianweitania sp. UT-5YL-CI-8]